MSKENFEIDNKENLAKTKYFSNFALKYFKEMKILKKGEFRERKYRLEKYFRTLSCGNCWR